MIRIEVEIDQTNPRHIEAASTFMRAIGESYEKNPSFEEGPNKPDPEPNKPDPKPNKPDPEPEEEPGVTESDIRKVMAPIVKEHREALKSKLSELGASKLPDLDPKHYETFYNFVKELADG